MEYTLFNPDGKPSRASVMAQTWLLDCRFELGRAQPDAAGRLLAHELTHVVQGGVTVRAWNIRKSRGAAPGARLAPAMQRMPAGAQPFLPEVDDEVLITFQSGIPRASAVMFNPNEYSLGKGTPWGKQGDAGMTREGVYRVRVARRTGVQPLSLALALGRGPALGDKPEVFRLA